MATPSIPASVIVNVTPQVIAAGGTGLDLSGLVLTVNASVPMGTVMTFPDVASVSAFFGPVAAETIAAAVYFAGFDGSNVKPAALLFAQYPTAAVPAYLRSGSLGGVSLTAIQALSGTITLTINGLQVASGSINLSSATSFSNAATLIQTAFSYYDAQGTGSIAGTTLTISAALVPGFHVGQIVTGTGVTAGTRITALGTGTGGTGTYTVSLSQTVSSTTINAGQLLVSYSSQLNAFVITGGTPGAVSTISFPVTTNSLVTGLHLTEATGAVTSQGSDIAVPATTMGTLVGQTQDFASFMTLFKPSVADMIALAAWNDGLANRFAYVMWDNDALVAAGIANPATAGYGILTADYSGTIMVYDPTNGTSIAAFVMGAIASLDFNQTDGRATLDFRSQSGLAAGVTDAAVRANLIANEYNFYGAFATANDRFVFFNPGSITGEFAWIDSYVDQIWLNNGFQLALMVLLTSLRSIPYNAAGYAIIESAMLDQVQSALNFGAIRAGVSLSASQASQVNAAAGKNISDTIEQRGWYIQVQDAAADVRAARGSPPVTFFYTDGQAVQTINLASVEVQ